SASPTAAGIRSEASREPAPAAFRAARCRRGGNDTGNSCAESPSARRRGARSYETRRPGAALPLSSLRAQGVFSNHRLQHVLVQTQVGHQLLQSRILFAELIDLLCLANVHASV